MPGIDAVTGWLSLEDEDGTWLVDAEFLRSSWTCTWGDGCVGIGDEPDAEFALGCCVHGAHLADEEDRRRVRRAAGRLGIGEWQHRPTDGRRSPLIRTEEGWATAVVDGACIFLNRSDAEAPGCALHVGALRSGEAPLDWKPEVCWQLPLRLEHHSEESGHPVHTLRPWRRRDWGPGGEDFCWWCTDEPTATPGPPVWITLADELRELLGPERYARFAEALADGVPVAVELGRRQDRSDEH